MLREKGRVLRRGQYYWEIEPRKKTEYKRVAARRGGCRTYPWLIGAWFLLND